MAKRDGKFWQSAKRNNATYLQYYMRLAELSMSMFEWTGLPDSIDPRFLELTLFEDGAAVFFRDEELGYLALQCAVNGGFNVYRIPLNRRAYAVNGYQKTLNINDSVIIYNNALRTNSMLDVAAFADRLYNIDRTIDVNVNAQKTPILIKCPESQRLTMENIYQQYDGNQPVIFGDKALNPGEFVVLKTDAPYMADKLYSLKTQMWNEALTYLGIPNVNIQKKERLVSDEVERNQGGTIASRYSRLEARRQACREINRMFPDLNVWCDYREEFKEEAAKEDIEVEKKEDITDE